MMQDGQNSSDTPEQPAAPSQPAAAPKQSPYETHEPARDPAFDRYMERMHNALVQQANQLIKELETEGGETNKVRDLSLSVLALSTALMFEQG
jgi:hypothetical protein